MLACTLSCIVLATACSSASKSSGSLLSWMEAHKSNVGLVAFVPGHESDGIFRNADEKFALASTFKVLVLGLYAQEVADRRLDPRTPVPLGDVARWYWPGTDGGAHQHALDDWRRQNVVDVTDRVPLDEVAWAMIRWSDNAAADYLIARVGGSEAVERFARSMGMTHQDPPRPVLGEFVAWSKIPLGEWLSLSPRERAVRAEQLARSTQPEDLATLRHPDATAQAQFAAGFCAGTPREWAHLFVRLMSGAGLSPAAHAVVVRALQWPLREFPANRAVFDRFAAKGGSLAGIITEVMYLRPKGKDAMVAALFLRNMPSDVWSDELRSFSHQALVARMANDDAFFRDIKRRLG
jgi:hypothetical protein